MRRRMFRAGAAVAAVAVAGYVVGSEAPVSVSSESAPQGSTGSSTSRPHGARLMVGASTQLFTSPSPVPVTHTQPADGQWLDQLTLPAILVPDETVELYAKASGYVSTIDVDIGSAVHKGDVLLVLDVPETADELRQSEAVLSARRARVEALKAKAQQAKLVVQSARAEQKRADAERELSQITYQRKQELFRGKAIPHQEFDEAKSQLAIADARVAIAQANVIGEEGAERSAQAEVKVAEAEIGLAEADVARIRTLIGYTILTAPFDGVVTRRNVDHGAFVRSAAQGATSPLLTVDKVNRLRLVIDIPEAQAPFVRQGAPVQIQLKALGEQPLQAAINRTAVAIRPDTRTMRAEVDLDNGDRRLAPGMYARAVIRTQAGRAGPSGG